MLDYYDVSSGNNKAHSTPLWRLCNFYAGIHLRILMSRSHLTHWTALS